MTAKQTKGQTDKWTVNAATDAIDSMDAMDAVVKQTKQTDERTKGN